MVENPQIPVVKRSLFSWIFSVKAGLQILLFSIIVITVFMRVIPLEMQKRIVNEAIKLSKIRLLFIYCGIYLFAVLTSNGLKFLINVLQNSIGQRVGAEMRKDLYHRILSLPLSFFRKTQPGMVVSSLVTELATAGDFIGMAVAVPLSNVLTLLVFTAYLLWLNAMLGILSFAIYPIGLIVVIVLQRKANQANNDRVDTSRKLSNKIAESVNGIHEIQGNGAHRIENRKYDKIVDELMKIRIIWNLYRFGIKVCSNFLTSFSQFLIFILGGYLAINGRLELGALVAFLSAQEKLYEPWKELIEFYQAYQDAAVSYYRTMEYFDVDPDHTVEPIDRKPFDLDGSLEIKNLSFVAEGGITLLDEIDFSLNPGEHMALVGFSGSGKSTLAHCIGQLYKYTGGHILIGKEEVSNLSKRDIARNVGFVSQTPFIFDGTFKENLLYACLARVDGNGTGEDPSMPGLDDMIEALQQTGIFVDVLRFGLNTVLDPEKYQHLIPILIRLRENFQENYGQSLRDHLEFFREETYLYYSSVAKNITFGSSYQKAFKENKLFKNEYFLRFLSENGLTGLLLDLGMELCRRTVDILGNLPPDEIFFEQNPMDPEEFDVYKDVAQRIGRNDISADVQEKLLGLALRFKPGLHKVVPFGQTLERLILNVRDRFREKASAEIPGAFSFYDMSEYLYSHTLQDNIFFGKMKTANPQVQESINQIIIQLLIDEGILETIVEIGMEFQVGSKGDRLSGGQRQKLAIARALLKKPIMLVMDEATSALDNKSQARIQNLLEKRWKGKSTLISVIHRLDIIKGYDKIAVMKAGKIGEIAGYDELMAGKGLLYELATGRKE